MKTLTRSLTHAIALGIIGTISMTAFSHANEAGNPSQTTPASQTRVLTSTDGRSALFTLIEKTPDGVIVLRSKDAKRSVIPFDSLIDSDKQFLANWTPAASPTGLIPSSVSISGNSTLTRGAYPCLIKPRYTNGAGGRVITVRGNCKKSCSTQQVTVTIPSNCKKPQGSPFPKP